MIAIVVKSKSPESVSAKMRKHKYRAYSEEHGMGIVYELDLHDNFVEVLFKRHKICETLPLERVKLMQSTGCKDSKGKEMFEGDIIFGDRVVIYECMSFYHADPTGNKFMFGGWYDQRGCIIIGNIYDNPELVDWFECPVCNNKPRKKKKCGNCCANGYLIKKVKK